MKQYIVDAFTDKIFSGNPAAVCAVKNFPTAELMQNIALENNLSETAFLVKAGGGYRLRWFTPTAEVDFCGHATLASGFVVLTQLEPDLNSVDFETLSGRLSVTKAGDFFELDFPAYRYEKVPVTAEMSAAVGVEVREAYLSRDLLMVVDSLEKIQPDFAKLAELDGLTQAVTAADENFDCVSRVFAPKIGVPEDPVTGSTHCLIAPYWAERLGKKILNARQASKRGGILRCEVLGERVKIAGQAALFAVAELKI